MYNFHFTPETYYSTCFKLYVLNEWNPRLISLFLGFDSLLFNYLEAVKVTLFVQFQYYTTVKSFL